MPVWLMSGPLPIFTFLSVYRLTPRWPLNRSILSITAGNSRVELMHIDFHTENAPLCRWVTVTTSSAGWRFPPLPSLVWAKKLSSGGRKKKTKEWWGGDDQDQLWYWLTVWIWSPDDLCLQSRLALTVVSIERERGVSGCLEMLSHATKGQSSYAVSKAQRAALKALSEDCRVRIHGAD